MCFARALLCVHCAGREENRTSKIERHQHGKMCEAENIYKKNPQWWLFSFLNSFFNVWKFCVRIKITTTTTITTKFEIIKTYCIICLFRWELTRRRKKRTYMYYTYIFFTTQADIWPHVFHCFHKIYCARNASSTFFFAANLIGKWII